MSNDSGFPQLRESILRAIAENSSPAPPDAGSTAARSAARLSGRADQFAHAAILGQLGLTAIAKRVKEIADLNREDPEDEPLDIDSLKSCAGFLAAAPDLQEPRIGVNPDGSLVADWRSPHQGMLALMFVPDRSIRISDSPGTRNIAPGRQEIRP